MQKGVQFFSPCLDSNALSNVVEQKLKTIAKTIVYLAHTHKHKAARRTIERYLKGIVNESTIEYIVRYLLPFRRRIECVAVTRDYVVVCVARLSVHYVFGIDADTGEIFVNAVRGRHLCECDSCERMWCGRLLLLFDKNGHVEGSVKSAFGFQYNYDGNAIGDTGIYRVQGEVVFWITRISELHNVVEIRREVDRYLQYLTYDRIMALLIDHGFSPEVVRLRNMTWVRLLGLGTPLHKERVIKLLERYFSVKYYGSYLYPYELSYNTNYGSVEVLLDVRKIKPRWERYYGLYMYADVLASTEATREIIEDIVESLKKAERVDVSTKIGRHVIELYRTVPLTFTYVPREMLYVLDPIAISVSLPRHYVVFPETEVFIRHPEHGKRIVRFDGTYLLGVGTTRVADLHIARLNRIAARRLQ
jgi:hypothetical protein